MQQITWRERKTIATRFFLVSLAVLKLYEEYLAYILFRWDLGHLLVWAVSLLLFFYALRICGRPTPTVALVVRRAPSLSIVCRHGIWWSYSDIGIGVS